MQNIVGCTPFEKRIDVGDSKWNGDRMPRNAVSSDFLEGEQIKRVAGMLSFPLRRNLFN